MLTGGVILFFMRRAFGASDATLKRVERRMDCFEQSQHACQLANAKGFATWEAHRKLDDKVDAHEGRISRLEAKG